MGVMSGELIDVLQPDLAVSPSFVVDINQPYVNIAYDSGIDPKQKGQLKKADGRLKFQKGENFQVLSIGIVIPLSFQIYLVDEMPSISMSYYAVDGSEYGTLPHMYKTFMPFSNYEFSLGVYEDTMHNVTQKDFYLGAVINDLKVSMIGVPTQLHNEKFSITVFLKIFHSRALLYAGE